MKKYLTTLTYGRACSRSTKRTRSFGARLIAAFAAVLCCIMTTTMFTACGDDDDDSPKTYSYAILFDFQSYHWEESLGGGSEEEGFTAWMGSILNAYKSALGVSSDSFTLNGTQEECDKKVVDACKKAETTVSTIRGGSATVAVRNTTTSKTVYTYQVRP